MPAENIGELVVRLSGHTDDFQKKWKDASDTLNRFANKAKSVGQGMVSVGAKLSLAVSTPIIAASAASVKLAADAEETASKFRTVFREVAAEADAAANSIAGGFGLARSTVEQLVSDTGDLLTGFGFSSKAALDLSERVTKLAVDLASFTNYSEGSAGASRTLTKALLGQREGLKSLGIAILDKEVQDRVAMNTAKGVRYATDRQAVAYATLEMAMEQSKNAIGDYARTSDSLANRMRLVQERTKDLSIVWGRFLIEGLELPKVIGKIITTIEDLTNKLSAADPSTKKFILGMTGIAALSGPVLVGLGNLTIVIAGLTKGMTALATVSKAAWISFASFAGLIAVGVELGMITKSMADMVDANTDLETSMLETEMTIDMMEKRFGTRSTARLRKMREVRDAAELASRELSKAPAMEMETPLTVEEEKAKLQYDETAAKLLYKRASLEEKLWVIEQKRAEVMAQMQDADKQRTFHLQEQLLLIDDASKQLKAQLEDEKKKALEESRIQITEQFAGASEIGTLEGYRASISSGRNRVWIDVERNTKDTKDATEEMVVLQRELNDTLLRALPVDVIAI